MNARAELWFFRRITVRMPKVAAQRADKKYVIKLIMSKGLELDFSSLPSISQLLQSPIFHDLPHPLAKMAARAVVVDLRQAIREGKKTSEDIHMLLSEKVRELRMQKLRPVINATMSHRHPKW